MDRSSGWTAYIAKLVFFTLAYLAAAKVSLLIQGDHDGITPIWPPSCYGQRSALACAE